MSAFDTPEWQTLDAAEMELHIAADRWHDSPTDPAIVVDLHRRVAEYRRARAAWVQRVATPEEAAYLAAELTPPPAPCPACGHQHATDGLAGICIGCSCERTTSS